ncbi:hypothetical protein Aperf_G00000106711 [Anoplocephala perfoliata]
MIASCPTSVIFQCYAALLTATDDSFENAVIEERLVATNGHEEYSVEEAIWTGVIKEQLVAWHTGDCAEMPTDEGNEFCLVRKPTAFTKTIHDDCGSELLYAGMRLVGLSLIISIFEWLSLTCGSKEEWDERINITFEGLAQKIMDLFVSGALKTIFVSRPDKDFGSSLAAALLPIGSRFGGTVDICASPLSAEFDTGQSLFF